MRAALLILGRSIAILALAGLLAVALYGLWRLPAVRTVALRADVLATIGFRERPASGRMAAWRPGQGAPEGEPAEGTWRLGRGAGAGAGPRASDDAAHLGLGRRGGENSVAPGTGPAVPPAAAGQGWPGNAPGGFGLHAGAGRQPLSLAAGLRQIAQALSIIVAAAALVIASRWLAGHLRPTTLP